MKTKNKVTVIRPSRFERLALLLSCVVLVSTGFILLVKYPYQQALLLFAMAIIYLVLNGRRVIELSDSGLSRRVGLFRRIWPKEKIELVLVEINFASQSGLYFIPQEILISVKVADSMHRVCSSFSYGLTPIATAVEALTRQYETKLEWRFRYCSEDKESADFADGDIYFQRVKVDLKKRIRWDFLIGGTFSLIVFLASIQAGSLEAGAVLCGVVVAFFSIKVGMLTMSQRTLVCPSQFKTNQIS